MLKQLSQMGKIDHINHLGQIFLVNSIQVHYVSLQFIYVYSMAKNATRATVSTYSFKQTANAYFNPQFAIIDHTHYQLLH